MTEHDRGAYTPQTDAPLAFDARGPRERRPIPMTLVGSAAVLVVLIAAVFMVYRHGARGADGAPRPVGEPVGQIKTAAAPGAQARDPAAGLDVYAAQNVPATPNFAPVPEEPAARPAPSQVQVRAAPEPAPVRIEAPPAAAVTTTTVATPHATTTTTTAAPAAAAAAGAPVVSTVIRPGAADALARATPRPAATRPAPPAAASKGATTLATARETDATIDAALARSSRPAAAASKVTTTTTVETAPAKPVKLVAAGGGRAVVQIGAYSSQALADKGYGDASAAAGAAMAGHGKVVTPVVSNGHTLYRTVITGFGDRAAAKAFCARLSAKGRTCIVKG